MQNQRVGILTDYFAAPSDQVAATAAEYVEGRPGLLDLAPEVSAAAKASYQEEAGRPRVRTAQSGLLFLQGKGVDPAILLGSLEEILTGRSYDEVKADPRQGGLIATSDDEGRVIVSVTGTLRDALAAADPAGLADVAERWEDGTDAAYLAALADLARQAVARGEHLYCAISI